MSETLPTFLRRTPEQIAAEKARQDAIHAAQMKGARLNRSERMLSRAALAEKAIRANLAEISATQQPIVWRETMVQLAETLAEQGRFEEAARAAHDGGNSDLYFEYLRLEAAVWRSDRDECACDASHEYTLREVWSEKHLALVPVKTCAVCGLTNAK